MLTLDKYFTEEPDWDGHPKLRNWVQFSQREDVAETKVELSRPRDVIGYKTAYIYMHFLNGNGNDVFCDSEPWEDSLNAGLVHNGFTAISEENEALRFALMLRSAFRKAVNRFGDGFFNSVLVHLISTSEFMEHEEIADVLRHHSALQPNFDSPNYQPCAEMIELALRGRASELTKQLNYPQPVASEILVHAVAEYLDERFSVTNRQAMGLL